MEWDSWMSLTWWCIQRGDRCEEGQTGTWLRDRRRYTEPRLSLTPPRPHLTGYNQQHKTDISKRTTRIIWTKLPLYYFPLLLSYRLVTQIFGYTVCAYKHDSYSIFQYVADIFLLNSIIKQSCIVCLCYGVGLYHYFHPVNFQAGFLLSNTFCRSLICLYYWIKLVKRKQNWSHWHTAANIYEEWVFKKRKVALR